MAPPSFQIPSPSPSVVDPADFETTNRTTVGSRANMLNIQALLNPTMSSCSMSRATAKSASPPPTPVSMPTSTFLATSQPGTPTATSSPKHKKQTKDNRLVKQNEVLGGVNYPPHECGEDAFCLSSTQKQELERQHKLFQVLPYSENECDLIGDYTRHIPYSSDKKSFGGKTGRDGFDVFQYFFRVPGDSTRYTVMWDYVNGLVRITPFFKACNYTKTIPAKALHANSGLKDLAHSITGGALDAQGYWMPYTCARALCMTFCYDIRWALTPIFGPSFIRDCLEKDDPRFGRHKIDAEIIRNAQLEADAWKTPSVHNAEEARAIPRSVPEETSKGAGKGLRPRAARPTFKVDSPFSSDSETTYTMGSSAVDSPEISPRSSYSSPAWTSINRPKIHNTPTSTPLGALENSLLNQPRYAPWCPATTDTVTVKSKNTTSTKLSTNKSHSATKRRRFSSKTRHPEAEYAQSPSSHDDEASESDSDDADIVIPSSAKKRARHHGKLVGMDSSSAVTPKNAKGGAVSQKYSAEDYRAARWLLNLTMRDADLATGPNGPVRLKD